MLVDMISVHPLGGCGHLHIQPRERDQLQHHLQLLCQDGALSITAGCSNHPRRYSGCNQRNQPKAYRRLSCKEAGEWPQVFRLLRDLCHLWPQRWEGLSGWYVWLVLISLAQHPQQRTHYQFLLLQLTCLQEQSLFNDLTLESTPIRFF